jgi:hypothetical protein
MYRLLSAGRAPLTLDPLKIPPETDVKALLPRACHETRHGHLALGHEHELGFGPLAL